MSSAQALSRPASSTQALSERNLIKPPYCEAASQQPLQSPTSWHSICTRTDLVAYSGVVAWFDGVQVALFYLPGPAGGRVHAIHNCDPLSGANVIGRGLLGQLHGAVVVASPLYKQHFRLEDGECLEKPELVLTVWPARLNGDQVEIFAAGHATGRN